jgi:hypothetical protein
MEIALPPSKGCIEKIMTGKITGIRLPGTEMNAGDVITASAEKPDKGKINPAITRIETPPLYAISPFEAGREGFISSDFCSSRYIRGNIEVRMGLRIMSFRMKGKRCIPETQRNLPNPRG